MEEFIKIFGGTWIYENGENIEESLRGLKTPENMIAFLANSKPTMTIEQRGDSIFHRTEVAPGAYLDITYQLDKEFDAKDPNDPPSYHNKALVTFNNGRAEFTNRTQLPNAEDNFTVFTVSGDKLTSETTGLEGNKKKGVVGRRFYIKKK
ncbi:uncharacterized protein LOC132743465 [Ruditapes philippinarum]|uniref:uncharacterized protein LOC132743465 n=1 Tax=Ruditapes philippinarum TaxID=129788 RepID=UPI00295C1387|nr:uncharacterized protein LOC132743465 [Ruditapes philippinarum]